MKQDPTIEELKQKIEQLEQEALERKKREAVLQAREQRLRKIFNTVNDSIFVTEGAVGGIEIQITEVNDTACRKLGYSRDELLSMSLLDIEAGEPEPLDRNPLFDDTIDDGHMMFSTAHRAKDGTEIPVEISTRFFRSEDRIITFSIARDIRDLRESEEKFSAIASSANDAIMMLNHEGSVSYWNRAAEDMFGYSSEEILGKELHMVLAAERFREAYQKAFPDFQSTGKGAAVGKTLELSAVKKDGTEFPIELSVSVVKIKGQWNAVGILRDISERKKGEEEKEKLQVQLHHAQRMEAIGTLAGGIAHDFNNLLMGIQGRTSLMLHKSDPSDPHYEHLMGIEEYVESAADLAKQLLQFARGGKYEVAPTDLNRLLQKSSELFGRTKKEINIHTKYVENIWTVDADCKQIEQVLLNLFVNAWQSMPGGGDLYLETENVTLDSRFTKTFSTTAGRYVKISVTDTGVGMDERTREKIFEPFFTTKEMGRGTGLGLASAYGIIKNHGGIINVYSEKGGGTTFNIYLPASDKAVLEKEESPSSTVKGSETILLVDDEDPMLDVGKAMLEELGYRVFIASSGEKAVDLFRTNSHEIDMVILDMIMPDMSGSETLDRLKEIDPDLKIILYSGYSLNGQAKELMERGCKDFLQKPFRLNVLSEKLRHILKEK